MDLSQHPRPDFERAEYLLLDGLWDFKFNDEKAQKILVPFAHQCIKSGIGIVRDFESITYRRNFQIPHTWKGKHVSLHFGAVDYLSYVYVNGTFCRFNEGGNTGFSIDITDYLNWKDEEIIVVCKDFLDDETIPRGKQSWTSKPTNIWYTNTSGIWQSVFIEPVGNNHITNLKFTPDIDKGLVEFEIELSEKPENARLDLKISFKGDCMFEGSIKAFQKTTVFHADIFNNKIFRTFFHNNAGWCWTPETPHLFDADVTLLENDSAVDEVRSYFGMRKVEAKNGLFFLNNKPYYQRLILDQGYFKDALMTAENTETLAIDIEMSKAMGFNGCRKHQKTEDRRFLYCADKIGYLVWSEVPSCPSFSAEAVRRITNEWFNMIKRDYNHPAIVAYVAINESWGVPNLTTSSKQRNHVKALYHTIKSLDGTRLVISNDGWEILETDIVAIHNYHHGASGEIKKQEHFRNVLKSRHNMLNDMPARKVICAEDCLTGQEPIMLTEFGGIAIGKQSGDNWGYSVSSEEDDFLKNYERIIDAIYDSDCICGFCYTQLTDVMQEMNGLLTADRKFKVAPEKIKAINERWRRQNYNYEVER